VYSGVPRLNRGYTSESWHTVCLIFGKDISRLWAIFVGTRHNLVMGPGKIFLVENHQIIVENEQIKGEQTIGIFW